MPHLPGSIDLGHIVLGLEACNFYTLRGIVFVVGQQMLWVKHFQMTSANVTLPYPDQRRGIVFVAKSFHYIKDRVQCNCLWFVSIFQHSKRHYNCFSVI